MTGPAADWPVTLGAGLVTDLDQPIRREWLVTNGRGSYPFGTVAGIATRVYHGLLVVALDPPVGRTVLVSGMTEWATVAGERVALHTHEYIDRGVDEAGFSRLREFHLDGMLPVFTYGIGDVQVERRIWMAYGSPGCGSAAKQGHRTHPDCHQAADPGHRCQERLTTGPGCRRDAAEEQR